VREAQGPGRVLRRLQLRDLSRDVEIASKVVELKQQYGYPIIFESSYAKNTVKHLRDIIETLASGGILSTGTLSLQSVDVATLHAIRRSNIKVEKYDQLAVEFGSKACRSSSSS
jgi:hypothetical protein